ncbi:prestin-like [Saccoglossus kowalevskii]
MNIPQGMAYAMLASLPAVYGLYLSFFAPLVYAVTGTSKDLAVGTYAIGSLMVRAAIQDVVPQYPLDEPPTNYMEYNNTNTTAISPPEWNREQELVDAAVIMALLVGVIQLAMGILRLGWVTVYLSDPFISGYLTGAACRVFTSQIDAMVGVKVRGHPGLLGLVYTYRDLLASAADWNYVTILISICCVLILISIKEIETKYKRQLHGYPLGSEIIVVILGVLFSYLLNLEEDYNVKVVGDLPAGVPAPSLPSTTYLTSLIGPAFPLAIVSYAIAIVVVSLFAQKKRYKIDANQELIAYGATNVVVSFLSGFPASAALDRSLVQDSAGGTSQIAGLVNSALMLVVLLWIGPLFEALPTAILASIIVVTLKEVFRKILAVPKLFKADLLDFHVWWVSCVAVLLFNVDFGLVIGIGYSIFMHVWRTQEPPCALLGRVDGTDLYKDIKQYSDATESRGIKIFCMQSSLYFVNIAHFMAKMYKLTGINPRKILQIKAREEEFEERNKKKQSKEMKKEGVLTSRETGEGNILTRRQGHYSQLSATVSNAISDNMEDDKDVNEWDNEHDEDIHGLEEGDGLIKEDKIHTIIIDCSSLNFIDSTALSGLRQLFKEYHKLGIKILLANCKKEVRDFLSRCNFYEDVGYEEKCCVFVTVHDAVLSAGKLPLTKKKSLPTTNHL